MRYTLIPLPTDLKKPNIDMPADFDKYERKIRPFCEWCGMPKDDYESILTLMFEYIKTTTKGN